MRNKSETVNEAAGSGMGITGLLGLIFVTLKLCGVIDWSWVWVTVPFWGPFVLVLAIALVAFVVLITADLLTRLAKK